MRARDARAIGFCTVTTLALLAVSAWLTHSLLIGLMLTAAYAIWVLTRPRMLRVFRRLRGEPDWSAYYDNDGTRFPKPAPGSSPPRPHPAERR